MKRLEVVWRGPLFGVAGYANEAREFVLGLDDLGAAVRAVDVPLGPHRTALDAAVERRLLELGRTPVARHGLRVEHSFPPRWAGGRGPGALVGRTMFETDRIPAGWVPLCNSAREVWVPSQFNVETFAASGVDRERLRVIPGPIRLADWAGRARPTGLPPHRFNFLSVFDWSLRKGWDVLLRAYCREFTRDDDVALVLKIHSSSGRSEAELRTLIRRFVTRGLGIDARRAPALVVVDRILSPAELRSLYGAAGCFVLPTRGEAWGRPYVEAAAAGVPVIATRWGGHTAFLNDENAYLVDVESLVPVPEEAVLEAPAFRGHRWAEPSVEHLRQLLRRAREDRDSRLRKTRAARRAIEGYDAAAVCARAFERLAALADS